MPARTRGQKADKSLMDGLSSDQVTKTPVNKTPKIKQLSGVKRVSFQVEKDPSGSSNKKSRKSVVKVQHSVSPKNSPILKSTKKKSIIKSVEKDSDDDSDDGSISGDDDEFDMELGDFMNADDFDEDSDGDDDDDIDEDDDDDDEDEDDSEDEVELSKSTKNNKAVSKPEKQKAGKQKELKSKQNKSELEEFLDEDDESDIDEDEDSEDEMEISKTSKKSSDVSTQKQKTPSKQKESKSKQKKDESNEGEDESQEPKKPKSKKAKKQEATKTFEFLSKDEREKLMKIDAERRSKRQLRLQKTSLFLKKLPADVTIEDLKSLSPDIVNVYYCRNLKKMRAAYLHFPSEATAHKNLTSLEGKSLKGKSLQVGPSRPKGGDGGKAKGLDFRRLQVVDLPSSVKIADVAQFFPKARQIELDVDVGYREALVTYTSPMEAKEEFENVKVEVNGRKVDVFYCTFKRIHTTKLGKRRRKSKPAGSDESAKKKKTSK